MQYGKSDFAVTTPSGPRRSTVPFSPAALCARAVRYGPASTVSTVVWKAEFAQSYITQPKISRRSFGIGIRPAARSRSMRLEGLTRDPLAQQRIDDAVPPALARDRVVAHPRRER